MDAIIAHYKLKVLWNEKGSHAFIQQDLNLVISFVKGFPTLIATKLIVAHRRS